MSEVDILPAPVLDAVPPVETKLQRERRAFLRLLPQLLQTHAGQYVAVHQETVVDSDPDLVPLALRVYGKFGYIPIYMDLVTDRPPITRAPIHRTLTSRERA